jgi:protein SCO1/2
MATQRPATRRRFLGGALLAPAAAALLAPVGARADNGWHNFDVSGSSPSLQFGMVSASDGKPVTQADFKGDVVLLYFGYTYCPDVCPLTLSNLDNVLDRLGKQASRVRVLFVTVDPDRDTLPILKEYTASFGPQVVGLRGSQDDLARLARRYRIAYSVTKPTDGHPYEVTHSSAIYAFDGAGAARLLIPSMASKSPDISGTADDLRRLIQGEAGQGLFSHMLQVLRRAV